MSNTITHRCNGNEYLIVEVEKDATKFIVTTTHGDFDLVQLQPKVAYVTTLPYGGDYQIMFIAEDASEDHAAEVVGNSFLYEDYTKEGFVLPFALESLQSLIRANFSDTGKNHLILQKL